MTKLPAKFHVKGVLFDLDGTLLDSAPDLVAALNWVRETEGLPALPVDQVRRFASRGAAGLLHAGMPPAPESEFETRKTKFLARYAQHSYSESKLYPGVTDLLDYLRVCAIPWGIVTNKVEALTLPIMRACGLLDQAGCVVCGDTLTRSKPDPAPVRLASDLINAPVAQTVFVGDDIRDIQAGRAAGTMTAAVHYGYGSVEFTDEWLAGSIQVHHPSDIIEWLMAEN